MTGGVLDGRFRLGVGIEDTFVPQESPGHRALDEYELTQHYERWEADLRLAADVGATAIRYGLPWYRIETEPGRFDWAWADRAIDLLDQLGLDVILDIVHYGTPFWLEGGFASPDYPERVAAYAHALARRYGDRVAAWTPLNEPQITAHQCGEVATWPPALTGHDGYLRVLLALCRGICLSQRAIAEAAPGAAFVHVEASFRYAEAAGAPSRAAALLRDRRFLALDLVTGRVGEDHELAGYLAEHGATDTDLSWFREHAVQPDVLGLNYYPMWSTFEYRGESGVERNDGVAGLEEVLRDYSARYGLPVMITETSYEGDVAARSEWLHRSLETVERLRAEIPIAGYIWWPFFDQIRWQYREGTEPLEEYIHELGLVALRPQADGELRRVPTSLFDDFRTFALTQRDRM